MGGVYRQGPDFHFDTRNVAGPANQTPGAVFAAQGATFHVPDVYALGLSFRPTDALTITADFDRVQYRQLGSGFVNIFGDAALEAEKQAYHVDNANEWHAGMEYVFVNMRYPLSLRLGAWLDPEHKVRFTGSDVGQRILFREGDDEVHYAGGLGMVFGSHFQVDAAVDLSDRIDVASLSMVARF